MSTILKCLMSIVVCLLVASAEKVRYDEYKVFKVVPRTANDIRLLDSIRNSFAELSFWNEPTGTGRPVSVLVPPRSEKAFQNFIDFNEIEASLAISNLQILIDQEEARRLKTAKTNDYFWSTYRSLQEFENWLEEVSNEATPNGFDVKKINVGKTYEGKSISGLEIKKAGKVEAKAGVILESGIHAREWISPAASSWIVGQILTNSTIDQVWREFNYLYVPIFNPDGYEYTHTKDRMWRKSRKPYLGGFCYGADLNRNWDSHWMEGGASSNPCLEDFAGSAPFSEVETLTISNYFRQHEGEYDIYISFHSFSQLLMFPWGYTGDHAPLHDLWQTVGDAAAGALKKVHGTEFEVGSIHDTIYPASGSSIEYFYDKYNSTLTFTFECRDKGDYGFLLPEYEIVPSGEELFAAVEEMLRRYPES